MEPNPIIVLIDGECAMCNRTALWFSVRDHRGAMLFAANTGEAARVCGEPLGGDQRTVVVWSGSRRLVRSAAIAAMLARLGGIWSLAAKLITCVPRAWADWAYDCVARRRHRLGGAPACALLNPWHQAD